MAEHGRSAAADEALNWGEQATAEVALGVANEAKAAAAGPDNFAGAMEAGPDQAAAEDSTEASLELKIAAEAPSSRQDMSVTIDNGPNDATTKVTVYANGSGGQIHDISGNIWQEVEGAISTLVDIAAVVTGQWYL